jgi:hypothetical protein
MTAHLDEEEDTVLKNFTIPSGLQTHYGDEIMKVSFITMLLWNTPEFEEYETSK